MDVRKIAVENLAYRLAVEAMGFYPAAVKGGTHPYDKRTEKMEGHNEALMHIHEKVCSIANFIEACQCRTEVEDALLNEDLSVSVDKDGNVKLKVLCNDVFYWGCSDWEEIKPEELKDLAECLKLTRFGTMLWVCKKRGMRPQIPWYDSFTDIEKEWFNVCGPERGNF